MNEFTTRQLTENQHVQRVKLSLIQHAVILGGIVLLLWAVEILEEMQVEDGISIADLYEFLNIPVEEIKLAYVNGIFCEPDTILKEGDEIGIFPPIGGGNH